jgi:hypothetical protein
VSLLASCQLCGGTGDRRHWLAHKPGCLLRHDAADCREADDLARPCRYLAHCHAERRGIQVQAGMRGDLCAWFQQHRARLGPDPERAAERQAIQGET